MKPVGCRARILIVEDEAIISIAIKRLLSNSGYEVAGVAPNAIEAIRTIETAAPDLVLMDIRIKGATDGVQTALKIRKGFSPAGSVRNSAC